jgi:hypothetical protein
MQTDLKLGTKSIGQQFLHFFKSTKLTESYFLFLLVLYFIFLFSKIISISSFTFIFIISLILVIVITRSVIPLILIVLIFTIDYLISINIIDFSSDGVTYHYEAMRRISSNLYLSNSGDKRIDSYPALPWLIGSIPLIFSKIISNDGLVNLNSFGKIGAASILFLYSFFQLHPLGKKRIFCATLLAFPPIFWSQFLTGYQDYFTYLFAAFATLSLFMIVKFNKFEEHLPILVLSLCLAGLIKYQGALFVIIFTPVIVYFLWDKYHEIFQHLKNRNLFYICVIFLTVSSLLIFLYINIFKFGKLVPFTTDVSTPNILFDNPYYFASERWVHFFHSLFSSPMINPEHHELTIGLPNFKEIYNYGFPDLRFGAYAPLTGVFIISILLFNLRKIFKTPFIFVALYVILLLLFLPGIGVARYYAFIQLIPPFLLLWIYDTSNFKFFSRFLLLSYLVVALGSAYSYFIKINNYQSFANEIKDKKLIVMFNGWEYHRYVLEKKFSVIFDINHLETNGACKPLIMFYPNAPLNDEVLICN